MGRVKSLEEIKATVRERTGRQNVFRRAKKEDVQPVLERLTSKDPDLWAAEWTRAAKPYEEEGIALEARGEGDRAREEDWQRKSTNAESYLMDHEIARATAFGLSSLEETVKYFPSLSLKTQGYPERPSCPMLIINGKDDLQTPIEDLYILLEHGSPKSARVFPGGHMGQTPETFPTVVRWLARELGSSS